ncbi:PRTRC system ThiF family protein [Pelobacter propionicus]|uniref:UBA/THIF-type NAD/FAD binding protein n=1 Tax=Pelobacter propionicus (strain DSM 2379 / NBRC 103807 / OttBd1) TaxID=338966 RepID=A0R7U8_PELPD|nr:PRTRC system ThiF family protein [Pelobacter propionicus]ABL01413.1 UBA/THIF-type NAD/FAD binding protein [Pelobacter propionicus DSM 2379]
MKRHTTDWKLLSRQVNVALVGCGGVGASVLPGLAKLHTAITALGHPGGLHVTVYDPDTVSKSNIGRQNYSPSDVGINKAVLSVHRINSFYGFNWSAEPTYFPGPPSRNIDLVVSCVDTKAARRNIAEYCRRVNVPYWLDYGNDLVTGQVILGQPLWIGEKKRERPMRLPTVTELFPEIMDAQIPEDDTPSCSLEEALSRQDLFIGQTCAVFGLDLLWRLFREAGIDNHGAFINLKSGRVMPLPVDKEAWKRFAPKKKRSKRTLKPIEA